MIQDVPYLAKFAIAFLVGAMPSVASARPSNAAPFMGACGRGSHFYHLARFAITFLVGAGRELDCAFKVARPKYLLIDSTDHTIFVATWRAVSHPKKRIVPPIALQPLHHAFTASLPTPPSGIPPRGRHGMCAGESLPPPLHTILR